MTAPRRRWFRFAFSLRTLFVVVTVLACWLGWERQIVRNRAATKRRAEKEAFGFDTEWPATAKPKPTHIGAIPWHRRLLGDEGYMIIWVPGGHPPPESLREEVRLAFPESIMEIEANTSY
jgi:hypothetical protein